MVKAAQSEEHPSCCHGDNVVEAGAARQQGFNIMRWGTRKVHRLNEPERSNSSVNDEWGFRRNAGGKGASPGPARQGRAGQGRMEGGVGVGGRGTMTQYRNHIRKQEMK